MEGEEAVVVFFGDTTLTTFLGVGAEIGAGRSPIVSPFAPRGRRSRVGGSWALALGGISIVRI